MTLKNTKNRLLCAYPLSIELHAHTAPASSCSDVSPDQMAQIYHDLGYAGLVLTNHFVYREDAEKKERVRAYLSDFEETKRAGERLGLSVYLGAEIRFTENCNDYLLYGATPEILEEVYDLLPYGLAHFREVFRGEKSLLIQAHPGRNRMTPVSPSLLDGIEVYNMHPNHNSRVGLVSRYAAENGVTLVTAGSDFHHQGQSHEGLAALRCRRLPRDSFDLARLLAEKDYFFCLGAVDVLLP